MPKLRRSMTKDNGHGHPPTRDGGGGDPRGGGGWRVALGSNDEAVALYRICLGAVLCVELVSRFRYLHPFYSDEG